MKKHLVPSFIFVLFLLALDASALEPKIDPIKFTLSTQNTHIGLNEEFELVITAEYLNINPNVAFVLKDANSFRLKLTVPDGFVKTGGDYYDYVGTELTRSKPKVSFKLKGRLTSESGDATFELLRSHKNADSQSTFVAVGRLTFNLESGETAHNNEPEARIAAGTPEFVPYMTIAQLRAGFADTAKVVAITDAYRAGIFKYDPADTASPDDSAVVLRNVDKRYKRIFDGPANAKWFGVIADGTDESARWQSMLNKPNVSSFYIEKTTNPYRLNTIVINRNNISIKFQDGAEIFGLGDELRPDYASMITLTNTSNVHISGKGWIHDMKETYPTSDSGQFQGCIKVLGSKDLVIEDIRITDVGGDGIYLGAGSGNSTNINATIQNVTVERFGRNGITVISCSACWVDKCFLAEGGTSFPGNGIDVEPNKAWEYASSIKLTNIYTAKNKGGILIALRPFRNSASIGDVVVDNHTDEGSVIGFTLQVNEGNHAGNVTVSNPVWRNPLSAGLLVYGYSNTGARVSIQNPTVFNVGSIPFYGQNAAFLFMLNAGDTTNYTMGNVHIYEPEIVDNRTPIPGYYGFLYVSNWGTNSAWKWTDNSIINPRRIQTANQWSAIACLSCLDFPIVSDRYGVLTKDSPTTDIYVRSAFGLGATEPIAYYRTITNKGATGLRTHTLSHLIGDKAEVTFEVKSAQPLRISPVTAWTLRPLVAINQSIQSNVVGSKITFKKDNASASWLASDIVGTWTDVNGNILFGPTASSLVAGSTSIPTKTTLNSFYGTLRANTIVIYNGIPSGARQYRKLTDSATSDWTETIWASGVTTMLP